MSHSSCFRHSNINKKTRRTPSKRLMLYLYVTWDMIFDLWIPEVCIFLQIDQFKGHWRRKFLLRKYLMLTYGIPNFIFSHVYCISFVRKWGKCSTLVRYFGNIPRMLIYARINLLTSLPGFRQYNDIGYLA